MRTLLPLLSLLAAVPAFALPTYSWELVGRGQATALNSSGAVVGYNGSTGFLYSGGIYSNLPTVGISNTQPNAINGLGQIAGRLYDSVVADRAFSYDGTMIQDLGSIFPGGTAWANGINDNGWTTGYSQVAADNSYEAFIHDGSTMYSIGNLGQQGSIGYGINNSGWVAGASYLAPGVRHAFLFDGTTMQDLGTLGGSMSQGTALNNNGMVAGVSIRADGAIHAMSYASGTGMVDLGTLGGPISEAFGINDFGWIVGASQVLTDGFTRAFLHDGTTMWNINDLTFTTALPTTLYRSNGINNNGQMIAYGQDGNSYLLTPTAADVPEPATWMLLSVGLAAAIRLRRR